MKLYFAILIWIATFIAGAPEGKQFSLPEVGVSVTLDDNWEIHKAMEGRPEVRLPGHSYVIDVDIENLQEARFNELWIQRFDHLDARQLSNWTSGVIETRAVAAKTLGRLVQLQSKPLNFDRLSIFEYEDIRGTERLKQSQGWAIYGVKGNSAFKMYIAGIKSDYSKNVALFKDILLSIEISPMP